MMKDKLMIAVRLVACALIIFVAAYHRDHRILGHEIKPATHAKVKKIVPDTLRTLSDGTMVINTAPLAKDVVSYAGHVPLEIYLREGRVVRVVALKNAETPDFFDEARQLLVCWNGKTLAEAARMHVDAVSGATFSSHAIIINVQRGLQYATKQAKRPSLWQSIDLSPKTAVCLIVVLMGAIIPLFYRHKRYRTLQLILNVAVPGFWCGTFISYAQLTGYLANGINPLTVLVSFIMLTTAFIYPFFGKKNHYCNHICPCGSLQELAGKATRRKIRMSAHLVKRLDMLRRGLWVTLMMLMLIGTGMEWMDYEIFSAFIFQSASWTVIVLGIVFAVLSIWVPRPYCRFVCPTGSLFKMVQSGKQSV